MSKYQAYRDRVKASGTSMKDAVISTTKRQAINYIMNSPTLSYVRLNDDVDLTPVIASDKETFHKRVFLFVPDSIINVGDYVHQTDGATYLAVDQEKDEIFPQLIGELCNGTFDLEIGEPIRTIVDYDDYKRPMYDFIKQVKKIPCVMTTKVPSIIENSSIPLPDGFMIIRIPYVVGKAPKENYVFNHRGTNYKVTTISFENVVNEIGFVEIRLQVVTGGEK